jgi:mRNA interferase MazF
MQNYSKHGVVLVRYPFSDLSSSKIRPAVVISASHPSRDFIITPLTSKTKGLLPGEFVLSNWKAAGLNVTTAVKRGIYTIQDNLIIKVIGELSQQDADQLNEALNIWLGLREQS